MGIRRISVIACVAGGLWLGACSSDSAKTSNTATSVVTTTTGVGTVIPNTTTTAAVAPTADPNATTTTAVGTGTTSTGSTTVTATTVAPRVVTSPSDNVKLGDSGDGVKQIQTALKAQGYTVTVDGNFGPQTNTAVKAFQKKNSLKQDGIVGPKTWAKLSGASTTSTTTKSGGTSGATTTVVPTSTTG